MTRGVTRNVRRITPACGERIMDRDGFESFEVTADVGVRASGETLDMLFANAARGMFALMVEPGTVRPAEGVPVEVHGEGLPSLLVAWLNELLFRCDAMEWAPADVRVLSIKGGRVRGELIGEPVDRDRHRFKGIVKAATYHLLECRQVGDLWRASIVFDV
ncbi:MAG: archease [Candidatus Methylomirabilaceae bacterium]